MCEPGRSLVATAGEFGFEKCSKASLCHVASGQAGAHRNTVCVIVFARKYSRERFRDKRTANRWIAIDAHGNTNAGAAESHAAFRSAVSEHISKLVAEIGVIDAIAGVWPEIRHFVTLFDQPFAQFCL